jgi:hypothetical protein
LLREPFVELASPAPELDASLAAHAVLGKLSDHLWERTRPSRRDVERIVSFCLGGAGGR